MSDYERLWPSRGNYGRPEVTPAPLSRLSGGDPSQKVLSSLRNCPSLLHVLPCSSAASLPQLSFLFSPLQCLQSILHPERHCSGWSGPQARALLTSLKVHQEVNPSQVSRLCFCLSFLFFCAPGKVYCALCAVPITATSSCLKQHCLGYWSGKGEQKTFVEPQHIKKCKKRAEMAPPEPPPHVTSTLTYSILPSETLARALARQSVWVSPPATGQKIPGTRKSQALKEYGQGDPRGQKRPKDPDPGGSCVIVAIGLFAWWEQGATLGLLRASGEYKG